MSNKPNWQEKPESTSNFGISIVIRCYKYFGKNFSNLITWLIAIYVWMFNKNIRNISKNYLSTLKKYANEKEISLPKLSSLKHIHRFCNNTLDQILSWQSLMNLKDIKEIDNAHKRFVSQCEKKTGTIIIGTHIGNIEMLRAVTTHLNMNNKLNIFIWTANNQKFMNYLKKIDPHSNLNLIPSNNIDPSTIFTLEEKIQNGEILVILGDRLTSSNTKTVEVNFLGRKAIFPQGPWILANLLKAPVFTAYNIYKNNCYESYFFEWGPISLIKRYNREEEIRTYVQKFANEIEKIIFEAPYDWFNFYNFWDQLPDVINEGKTK